MKQGLQIFIEYKIKPSYSSEYENQMSDILNLLPDFGAEKIQWFVSSEEDNHYVEMYEVPTESHHYALKKLRLSTEHQIFGVLERFIEGGTDSIQYWALKSLPR